jgi:hypothetical protein
MCHVCRITQQNTAVLNGRKPLSVPVKLYTFYHQHRARLVLCHYHSVELFKLGERRFLMEYVRLAQDMQVNKQDYVEL